MNKESVELYEKLHNKFYDRCISICDILAKYKESFGNLTTFVIVENEVVGTCGFDECYVGQFDKNLLWASNEEIEKYGKENLQNHNQYIFIDNGV